MAWAVANPRGKATGNGGFLTATVAFTGLPDRNDAFGKKKVILLLNGRKLEESDCEVFFPKTRQTTQEGRRGARIGSIIGDRHLPIKGIRRLNT